MPSVDSFRAIAEKFNNYELRKLISIAVTDVAVSIAEDSGSSEELKELARKVVANSEVYAEKLYPIILRDSRVETDVPDSTLRILVKEAFDFFL